jgi:hypothetical protein
MMQIIYGLLKDAGDSSLYDAFLLQDINTKMHKKMVLMCSATLNRLQITPTD